MRYREGKTAPFPLPLFSRCESPEQQSGTAQNRSIRSGQGRARKGGREERSDGGIIYLQMLLFLQHYAQQSCSERVENRK